MFGWKVFAGMALIFAGSTLSAQSSARPTDPVFTRAQALVSDGNGAAGRALIDSMIAATPTFAPLYPQALFWRASLAASAADAESDYKHIVVDYPLTPQAPEALLRLAQLELARGDRDGALGHLQRIPRDYPNTKSLARANYWIARVLFEKNDLLNGCAANANALARLDSSEIELRNQIQYQGQRCPPPTAPAVVGPSQPAASQTDSARPKPTAINAKVDAETKAPIEAKRATVSAEPNDLKPGIVDPTKAIIEPAKATIAAPKSAPDVQPVPEQTASGEKPATVPKFDEKPTTAAQAEYSVQVAAYKSRAEADKLAESLRNRGYEARVDVSPDWFRVRVGRYASEGAAETKRREMKAKQLGGFVVRAPSR